MTNLNNNNLTLCMQQFALRIKIHFDPYIEYHTRKNDQKIKMNWHKSYMKVEYF